jgi:hypothetical protein
MSWPEKQDTKESGEDNAKGYEATGWILEKFEDLTIYAEIY